MQTVITTKCLNIDTTVITNLKTNKITKQLTAGIINSKTNSAVYIEVPYLINPFGLSFYDGGKEIKEENKSWSLVLKAQGKPEEQDDINLFFKYLKDLDEKAIDFAISNSQAIFKKKYEPEQRSILVDLLYNRCVKQSIGQDGTIYPDKITLKIMKNNNMLPDVLVFKDSPVPVDINSWEELQKMIIKGTTIKTIIQPRFYIVNGKCGINAKVIQIKIPNVQKIGKPLIYAFSEKISNTKNTEDKEYSENNIEDSESDNDSESEVVNVDE
jgi:hypothetical protein